MKNSITLLSVVAILFSLTSFAQTAGVPANVKGTPYLDDAYVNAEIAFANNTRTMPVRYNAYKDNMEYQQNGQALVLDPAPTVKRVTLAGETFVVEKYNAGERVVPGYFALLDTGKLALYSKKEVRFVPARKGAALDGTDQPAEFKRTPDAYYYKLGTGNLQEIKNIKTLIAALPDKQEEMTQYVKKEKISARDGEELRQFVKHYNDMRE
jgi:hypothetical protein